MTAAYDIVPGPSWAPVVRRRSTTSVGGELLRAFERGVARIGAETINLGADEAVGFYVRHGYQTLLLLQWVYDASKFETEVAALLAGPLDGMDHRRSSFNGVPRLFVTLDEPSPTVRAAVADLVSGAHVGYAMTRNLAPAIAAKPEAVEN